MRVIIAGSRTLKDKSLIEQAVKSSGFQITAVVCGMAQGIDTLGSLWAQENNIPVKYFPANWKLHGIRAGMIRNKEMANYADALIAIKEGVSKGTANMIEEAGSRGLPVFVLEVHP